MTTSKSSSLCICLGLVIQKKKKEWDDEMTSTDLKRNSMKHRRSFVDCFEHIMRTAERL